MRFRLALVVVSFVVSSFASAQTPAPTTPPALVTRLTAEVFAKAGAPATVRDAAKAADEVAERTADARKKTATHVSAAREALVAALASSTTKLDEFVVYDDFLVVISDSVSDANKAERELELADAMVAQAHLDWLSSQKVPNLAVVTAFADWLDGAVHSHFTAPADAIDLMDQGQKRMGELIAADRAKRARRNAEDDRRLKELQDMMRKWTPVPPPPPTPEK